MKLNERKEAEPGKTFGIRGGKVLKNRSRLFERNLLEFEPSSSTTGCLHRSTTSKWTWADSLRQSPADPRLRDTPPLGIIHSLVCWLKAHIHPSTSLHTFTRRPRPSAGYSFNILCTINLYRNLFHICNSCKVGDVWETVWDCCVWVYVLGFELDFWASEHRTFNLD